MPKAFTFSEVASPFEPHGHPCHSKRPSLSRYRRVQRDCERVVDERKRSVAVNLRDRIIRHDFGFVDLFSGAGGLSLGFVNAGFRKLLSVEVDPDACATIRRNFPGSAHFSGRVQDLRARELERLRAAHGRVRVVCGGPPCQGFSVAGARDPGDARNGLFREFVRIAAALQPDYVVLENVPGILTMMGGAVRAAICDAFAAIGYPGMSVAVLEAAAYGVPQIRPRAIFIANRLGLSNPFPAPVLEEAVFLPIESAIMDLADRRPDPAINHEWTRHSAQTEARIARVPPGGSLYATYLDAFKRQYPGKPAMTVKENHGGSHVHPHRNRVLSAREMARLQTFPDTFILAGTMKRAMWQIGNAVPPLLARHIALAIATELAEHRDGAPPNDRRAVGDGPARPSRCASVAAAHGVRRAASPRRRTGVA